MGRGPAVFNEPRGSQKRLPPGPAGVDPGGARFAKPRRKGPDTGSLTLPGRRSPEKEYSSASDHSGTSEEVRRLKHSHEQMKTALVLVLEKHRELSARLKVQEID